MVVKPPFQDLFSITEVWAKHRVRPGVVGLWHLRFLDMVVVAGEGI
jgi:hypothetical protein